MAKDKRSFILYADLKLTIDRLPDQQAGMLFKTILDYVNDTNPEPGDLLVQIAFEPIRQQLKRDLKKWERYIKKQKDNGKLGGRPKTQDNPEKGLGYLANPTEPKKADSVTVTVNDSVNVIDINTFLLKENEIGKTIEFAAITLHREYTAVRVAELWKAFLITGAEKSYPTDKKRIDHFRRWLKTQPHGAGQSHQQLSADSPKLGTSAARIAALKNW
jgi:hypothetical protein